MGIIIIIIIIIIIFIEDINFTDKWFTKESSKYNTFRIVNIVLVDIFMFLVAIIDLTGRKSNFWILVEVEVTDWKLVEWTYKSIYCLFWFSVSTLCTYTVEGSAFKEGIISMGLMLLTLCGNFLDCWTAYVRAFHLQKGQS